MSRKSINISGQVLVTLFGLISLGWWLFADPVEDFRVSVPGMDNRPAGAMKGASVNFGGYFEKYDGIPSEVKGSWPNFRGPDGDNISKEKTRLSASFGENGPEVLWSIDLGEGHSGPIIADGKVYVMDYDEERRADVLRCFSFDDGREIWRTGYDIYLKRNHGISRTVPAIKDNYVVTIGPKCHVMCVDADSGKVHWGVDLELDFNTEMPLWYTGQCPMIDDSLVVIGVGGSSLLAAFNLATGDIVWETPNPNNWKMSHSSVTMFYLDGEKIYFYCALGGVTGVSEKGEVLFESALFNHQVVAPSPVYLGDGKVFLTAGYGAGSMTIKIDKSNGGYGVTALQTIKPNEGIAAEQQTPVLYKGLLYSLQPKDAGSLRNQFVCYDPDDITKLIWSSGKEKRYGLGPYLIADNKFFILSDEGELTIINSEADSFEELGKYKVLDGHDAWGPMAIVDGRLFARDSRTMVCLDLRAN